MTRSSTAARAAGVGLLGALALGASGCQLIALPFQIVIAVLQLAAKLVPLVPLFVYEPVGTPTDVQVATASDIDRVLVIARSLDESTPLPTLDGRALDRPLPDHQLAGVIFVPASDLRRGDHLQPLLDDLAARGYVVQVGPLLDGASLAGDERDLLACSRLRAAAQHQGLTLVATGAVEHLTTDDTATALVPDPHFEPLR
jgi:hypothetical protein